MENEKKKNNTWLIVLLVLIILLLVGYICYDKFSSKENRNDISPSNVQENNNEDVTETTNNQTKDDAVDYVVKALNNWLEYTEPSKKRDGSEGKACFYSGGLLFNAKNDEFWQVYAPYFYFCQYGKLTTAIESEYSNYLLASNEEVNAYYTMFPNNKKFELFTNDIVKKDLSGDWDFIYDEVNNEAKDYYGKEYLIIRDVDIVGEGNQYIYKLGEIKQVEKYYTIDITATERIDYGEGVKTYKGILKFKVENNLPIFEKTSFSLNK